MQGLQDNLTSMPLVCLRKPTIQRPQFHVNFGRNSTINGPKRDCEPDRDDQIFHRYVHGSLAWGSVIEQPEDAGTREILPFPHLRAGKLKDRHSVVRPSITAPCATSRTRDHFPLPMNRPTRESRTVPTLAVMVPIMQPEPFPSRISRVLN